MKSKPNLIFELQIKTRRSFAPAFFYCYFLQMASISQNAENYASQFLANGVNKPKCGKLRKNRFLTNGVSKPKCGKCGKLGGILAENQTLTNSVSKPKCGKAEKFSSIFV